jgi:C4-dicarboxylate-binding protein DctP
MILKWRHPLGLVFGLAMALMALTLRANAEPPIVIKFSHVTAPGAHKSVAAEKFKELAEKALGNRIRIELYPNSQLYKDKEEMEALQLGAVQMLCPSLSKFGPLGIKDFEVFDLPYLFSSYADVNKITQGPIGKELLKKLESKGIKGLTYWNNGFKILSANQPLITPDDMLGLKMRIQASKVIDSQMMALGAMPQVMAYSEAYQALATGVVDGTENTPANLYTQKMYEVQKHATLTNHAYLGYAVITNKQFWDHLPDDVRITLEKILIELTPFANELAEKENAESLEAVRRSGKTAIHVPTPEELAAWREALLPVRKEMSGRVGAELIRRIEEAVAQKN